MVPRATLEGKTVEVCRKCGYTGSDITPPTLRGPLSDAAREKVVAANTKRRADAEEGAE
jgi:hypothetical protein